MSNLNRPLPLFPLPTVLFPGQILPLYVFEERYRVLLRRVEETGQPFGIVCIEQSGRECELPLHERVSPVGTLAHLLHSERHEDGTSSVVVAGGERFRVKSFDLSQPYLSGVLESWPLSQEAEAADLCALRAQQLLAGLQRAWPEFAPLVQKEAPQDPLLVATYASKLLLAQRGDTGRLECNAALYEPTLAGRLGRLIQALPPVKTTLN